MPLDKTQGLRLSNDELLGHLLENAQNRIQLAERLPFFPISGDSLRVERASAVDFGIDPAFDDQVAPVAEGVAIPTLSLETKFELKLLTQQVNVFDFVAYNQSSVNSQVGVQLEAATRRMLYKFWKSFGVGAGPTEFDGIRTLTIAGQTIDANDPANFFLDLIDLARLVAKVTANNGRPHVLWGNPKAFKSVLLAYFEKGLEPEYVMVSVPDSNGGMTQRPCLAFQGIPIYIDEFYPDNESVGGFTDGTSLYAITLGRGGLYGIVPSGFGSKMIRVKEVLGATTAQTVYRLFWPVGLCLEKQDAVARLRFRKKTSVN
jgi:hypothetical protein